MTLFRAEAGSPAIVLGTLLRILAVLGLEADLEARARDDKAGRLLQDLALPPPRRRGARASQAFRTQGARAVTDEVEVWLDADFLERMRVGTLSHDRGTLRFAYDPVWCSALRSFRHAAALLCLGNGPSAKAPERGDQLA